ncbi:MAG TPA: PP2C family protein-serine/threonine phosphatase, partial [Candidatus Acidoferrum sp.]|nr:PP2C family protein-serine/threonine phosphatase [Candidatus Acidoferrum sp.]
AVLARRVFGIRFFIRRGLQYLLLSRGTLVLEGLLIVLIVTVAVSRSASALNSPLGSATFGLGSGIVGMVALRGVNKRLMPALDRRFFRESLDVRRILLELDSRISSLHDRAAILGATRTAVSAALHVAAVSIWQKTDQGSFVILNDEATVAVGPDQLSADQGIVRQLMAGATYVDADTGDIDSRVETYELWIPFRSQAGLMAFAGLGAKLSEEPFSSEDRELLVTMSHHVGMALENAELLEVARREAQLTREFEIARDIQHRLFPSSVPDVASWQLAGACIPAGQVGGDYYDIFEIDPQRIVLSLGDVSGKGLGASFTMSSVHATIRTKRALLLHDPACVIQELNGYLVDSTPPETFVSLFLAILDTTSGTVRYFNCGHPPALILRGKSREVEFLSEGSTLLGSFSEITVREGESHLEPGDMILIYSDGVTEASDNLGRLYGAERLLQAVRECRDIGEALLADLLSDISEFRGSAAQSDDVSIVLATRLTR